MARLEQAGLMLRRCSGPRPLQIELWRQRHRINLGMAYCAHNVVLLGEQVLHATAELNRPALADAMPPQPSMETWLSYYNEPLQFYRILGDKLSRSKLGTHAVEDYEQALTIQQEIRAKPARFKSSLRRAFRAGIKRHGVKELHRAMIRGMREGWKCYRQHLREMRMQLQTPLLPVRDDLTERLSRFHAMHFALSVYVPCMVQFRTTPGRLLTAAQGGDTGAIEKLVRLDPRMAAEPRIQAWTHEVQGGVRIGRIGMIAQWQRDGLRTSTDARSIKTSAAGLVSALGELFAYRLRRNWSVQRYKITATQILDLFHAVAKDRGRQTITGKDLDLDGCGGDGWSKAVQRLRHAWTEGLGLNPDTDSLA